MQQPAIQPTEAGLFTVNHGEASLAISIHGANLVSYVPSKELGEVIWTGGYEPVPGENTWGGIPIVWPWFMLGAGENKRGPFHGPARFATWEVLEYSPTESATELRLGAPESLKDAAGVPIPLALELNVRLADHLRMELVTRNLSDQPFPLEHCYHAYFKVGDVTRIRIDGLEGSEVRDNRSPEAKWQTQLIPVTLDGPAARFYRPFPDEVTVEDPVLGRRITLRSSEASHLVLWNSGPIREEDDRTTGEAEWRTQLALEPLRGLDQTLTLPPGGEARLSLEIQAAPLPASGSSATY